MVQLLRARSMLYCICRKPYGQRAMIACDQCDEWYHFDCIKLVSVPKIYICPACKPIKEELPTSLLVDHERLAWLYMCVCVCVYLDAFSLT